MTPALDAALDYAARGWPVFPMSAMKRPLTEHGLHDAALDADQIRTWWRRWPQAWIAVATGERSGIVAIDIDRHGTVDGFDVIEELGIATLPVTPMACTPRFGLHLLFRWPGRFVKSKANALGPGVDVRGDGGSIILPPRPRGYWDPCHGLDVPLADLPAWAMPAEVPDKPACRAAPRPAELSAYARAALEGAIRDILDAGDGGQRAAINGRAYHLGQLVALGKLPADIALGELEWAASKIQTLDPRRPWRPGEVKKLVRMAFLDGQREPRGRRHAS